MKSVLIKLGGSVITDNEYRKSIIQQLVKIKQEGYDLCIVHGGGKLISYYLNKLEIESKFYEGLRITPDEALDVVMMALVGKVNKDIVKDFNLFNVPVLGLCGGDGTFITAKKLVVNDKTDLGQVGVPIDVNKKLFNQLIELDYVLVIATIAWGDGGYYNVNADHTASFVAKSVGVDHLVFVSDVDGVLNPNTGHLYKELDNDNVQTLFNEGVITEGMLPKLYSCLDALDKGVKRVTILNGKTPDAIINAVINKEKPGTEIIL